MGIPTQLHEKHTSSRQQRWLLASSAGCPPYWCFDGEIVKLPNDQADYRLIKLQNGMEILLCSDPAARTDGVCLTVPAGTFDEPVDAPGVAHLLEHCISKSLESTVTLDMRHPNGTNENLDEYLTRSGERDFEASTHFNHTVYGFTVPLGDLQGALRILSAIFYTPRLVDDIVRKEVIAVDAEFQRMREQDKCRWQHLNLLLSRQDARCNRFFEGDYASLTAKYSNMSAIDNPSDEHVDSSQWRPLAKGLLEWWSENYFSRPSTLVLLGQESLDDLAALVSVLFSSVTSLHMQPQPSSLNAPSRFRSPWTHEQEGSVIYVQAADTRLDMGIRWVIPKQPSDDSSCFAPMLVALCNDRGIGSPYALLLEKGWVYSLHASIEEGDAREGYGYFAVILGLTWQGWDNWRQIVETLQEYIILLQESELSEDVLEDFRSMDRVTHLTSKNGDVRTRLCKIGTALLGPVARRDILRSHIPSYHGFTYDAFRAWLVRYFKPQKLRVMLSGFAHWDRIGMSVDKTWMTAPWYGTAYTVRRWYDPTMVFTASSAQARGLRLPQTNPFVPRSLTLHPLKSRFTSNPTLLRDTPGARLWFKQDGQFQVPRGNILCRMLSPKFFTSPRAFACYSILFHIANWSLGDATVGAYAAGYNCCITFNALWGLTIEVEGYNDKLSKIFGYALDAALHTTFTPEVFILARTEVYNRVLLSKETWLLPYTESTIADETTLLGDLLCPNVWSPEALCDEIADISENEIYQALQLLRGQLSMKLLTYGNVLEETAVDVFSACHNEFNRLTVPRAPIISWLCLPEGINFIFESTIRADGTTSQIGYYCDLCNAEDYREYASATLAYHMLRQEVYRDFLWKFDLGYYADIKLSVCGARVWLYIALETPCDTAYAERCIDRYLAATYDMVQLMDEEQFSRLRQTTVDEYCRMPQASYHEEIAFLHSQFRAEADSPFASYPNICELLPHIERADVLRFMDSAIHPQSATRRKLSVRWTRPRYLGSRAAAVALADLGKGDVDGSKLLSMQPPLLLSSAIEHFWEVSCAPTPPEEIEEMLLQAAERYPHFLPHGTEEARAELWPIDAFDYLAERRISFVKSIDHLRAML